MMTDRSASAQALALTGGLLATWDALHPLFDQWFQGGRDAANKGAFGHHLVYRDGTPVGQEAADDDRSGQPTMTATRLGWTSAARHVASLGFVAEVEIRRCGFSLVGAMKRPRVCAR
ncbi:hypothetical protein ACWDYG_35745, partial [Streptomyces olivaceus]